MALYYTKSELYNRIHKHKEYLGFNTNEIGLDLVPYCKEYGYLIEKVAFSTKGLRGMATVSDDGYSDAIILNSERTRLEHNFDCAHEMMHLAIHRNLEQKYFKCMEKFYSRRDSYVEWQANEGAAELLVPYKVLLPLIGDYRLENTSSINSLKETACSIFNVSVKVIENRFESLKYEIDQYRKGTDLKDIHILSITRQQEMKINVKSINDIENELLYDDYLSMGYGSFINIENILNNI